MYYHLKDPILAIKKLSDITNENMFLAGHSLDTSEPLMYFYKPKRKDRSNFAQVVASPEFGETLPAIALLGGPITAAATFAAEKLAKAFGKDINDLIKIKVRSTGRLLKSKISITGDNAKVEILDAETGISPGQACVFYSKDDLGDKLLGGGWIHKTYNKNLST